MKKMKDDKVVHANFLHSARWREYEDDGNSVVVLRIPLEVYNSLVLSESSDDEDVTRETNLRKVYEKFCTKIDTPLNFWIADGSLLIIPSLRDRATEDADFRLFQKIVAR